MFAVPLTLLVKPVLVDVDRDEAWLRRSSEVPSPASHGGPSPAFPSETGEARVNVEP